MKNKLKKYLPLAPVLAGYLFLFLVGENLEGTDATRERALATFEEQRRAFEQAAHRHRARYKDVQRRIEFTILENPQDKWDVRVTVDGETMRAMTAYSYFGKSQPPRGFVVALLREDRSELLVFRDGDNDWLEFGDYRYDKCN